MNKIKLNLKEIKFLILLKIYFQKIIIIKIILKKINLIFIIILIFICLI